MSKGEILKISPDTNALVCLLPNFTEPSVDANTTGVVFNFYESTCEKCIGRTKEYMDLDEKSPNSPRQRGTIIIRRKLSDPDLDGSIAPFGEAYDKEFVKCCNGQYSSKGCMYTLSHMGFLSDHSQSRNSLRLGWHMFVPETMMILPNSSTR
jgi:hypothetical protein